MARKPSGQKALQAYPHSPEMRVFLCAAKGRQRAIRGFTLIELLVVIAIIAILAAVVFPVFARARQSADRASCLSNLKQLALAMLQYADDSGERFVPAAADIFDRGGGKQRWHGYRDAPSEPFDPARGPLWPYLGRSRRLKVCKVFERAASEGSNQFESGCGGYGYNHTYVGGSSWKYGPGDSRSSSEACKLPEVVQPALTVLIADAGIAQGAQGRVDEYSFIEPVWYVAAGGETYPYHPTPSIHFRHSGAANVAWVDGHVTTEQMAFTADENAYGADNRAARTGWFGPRDNSLFDLE